MRYGVGLDFGTTNSALGVASPDGDVKLARFAHPEGASDTLRSILYFHPDLRGKDRKLRPIAGARAIERYLDADGEGRLIQSLKSYLADRRFESTALFHRNYTLAELLTMLLQEIRGEAESDRGFIGGRIVVGRPVRFANAHREEDDDFAVSRLRAALEAASFGDVIFEYEPVAAAYFYERRLDHDELVLIADFGGGTSDFSLIEVGPSRRAQGARRIVGNEGVAIAGDALDAKIVHHLVAPCLGLGTTYRSVFDQVLTVPVWLYTKLRRWHHLSFLKSPKTIEMLEEIADQSAEPGKIRALLHLIDHDLGYHLYRAVERAKVELSSQESTRFVFNDGPIAIDQPLTRADFEQWTAEETGQMAASVDRLLDRTGVPASKVDQVFMTGGTSFVPAVRRIFEDRFGAAKIRSGGEMISVATGLALRAAEA